MITSKDPIIIDLIFPHITGDYPFKKIRYRKDYRKF